MLTQLVEFGGLYAVTDQILLFAVVNTTVPSRGKDPPQPSEALQSRQPETMSVPGKVPPEAPKVILQSCP